MWSRSRLPFIFDVTEIVHTSKNDAVRAVHHLPVHVEGGRW